MTLEEVADAITAEWYGTPAPVPLTGKRERYTKSQQDDDLRRLVTLVDEGIRGMGE